MRVELVKSYQFEAAHKTAFEKNGTRPIHGHSFRIEICVEGDCSPKLGWLIDYGEISELVDPLYKQLDHKYLNEVPGMTDPALPGIRSWLLARLRPTLPQLRDVSVSIVGDACFRPVSAGQRIDFTFEAAHFLPHLPATHKCRHLHGHSFRVGVLCADTAKVRGAFEGIYATLDHICLNDIPGLENPTSEMVANWLWERLVSASCSPTEITVAETCTARCIYRGE